MVVVVSVVVASAAVVVASCYRAPRRLLVIPRVTAVARDSSLVLLATVMASENSGIHNATIARSSTPAVAPLSERRV